MEEVKAPGGPNSPSIPPYQPPADGANPPAQTTLDADFVYATLGTGAVGAVVGSGLATNLEVSSFIAGGCIGAALVSSIVVAPFVYNSLESKLGDSLIARILRVALALITTMVFGLTIGSIWSFIITASTGTLMLAIIATAAATAIYCNWQACVSGVGSLINSQ